LVRIDPMTAPADCRVDGSGGPDRYKSDEAGTEAPPGHSCSGVGSPLLPEHTLRPRCCLATLPPSTCRCGWGSSSGLACRKAQTPPPARTLPRPAPDRIRRLADHDPAGPSQSVGWASSSSADGIGPNARPLERITGSPSSSCAHSPCSNSLRRSVALRARSKMASNLTKASPSPMRFLARRCRY
jgi:hypothetical protein